ncbi:MAG: hypothetical protein K2L07_10585 [Lachnospiraceae bacterium]|nr:hypothetical protein [Lachnospiraceae bacterium]
METFLDSFMEYGIEIASDDIVKIKSELSKIEINVVAINILDWLELERKRELWIEAGRKTKLKPLQLNFKYDWCNNLKKMVEEWKVFEKYFYIVEDKFDFLPEVDEATRTAIRDTVYKNYNPTSPRKNIGIVKK